MESIIYVVESSALIEGIHLLKQWIYEDKIKLLLPNCTLHSIEKAAKASLAPKEESKQQPAKQTGGRAKKEYPLFDINPRTAWEFVERARLGKEAIGVAFQQENEVFAQWKNEEEKDAVKEELALPPPTSFADALSRKLAVKEDGKELKAPFKPKLIAKAKDQKTAWKIDKTPTLSATGLTADDKSLLSCMLWRVYEAKSDPLQPTRYVLLVNEQNIKNKAHDFELATVTIGLLRKEIEKAQKLQDKRKAKGQLEEDFPEILVLSKALDTGDDLELASADFGFLHSNQSTAEQTSHEIENGHDATTEAKSNGAIDASTTALIAANESVSAKTSSEALISQPAISAIGKQVENEAKLPEQATQATMAPHTGQHLEATSKNAESESELDSDEEIIVFNPRNRRASGHPGSSSRPGSSAGFIQKFYKAGVQTNVSHAAPSTPTTLEPQTPRMRANSGDAMLSDYSTRSIDPSDTIQQVSVPGLKSPMEFKLKAQSPVFTPGQPFPLSPTSTPISPVVSQISNSNGSQPPTGPKNAASRRQRGGIISRPDSHDLVRIQKENSERMIQRQREAIQRQSHNIAIHPKPQTPTSPRLIQMEPTDSPTIIDPDAFDRTYIVQAPTAAPNTTQRQNGHKRGGRGSQHRNQGRERPPSIGNQSAEPGADFVLMSGAPRRSTHEKGKLWVP